MAQLTSKKTPSRFQPELDANNLVSYTTHIVQNDKYFSEEMRISIIPEVLRLCMSIADKVNFANSINVKNSLNDSKRKANYKKRIEYEREALYDCVALKSKVTILHLGFHLPGHKVRAWNAKINNTISSLTAWYNSELIKYKEI